MIDLIVGLLLRVVVWTILFGVAGVPLLLYSFVADLWLRRNGTLNSNLELRSAVSVTQDALSPIVGRGKLGNVVGGLYSPYLYVWRLCKWQASVISQRYYAGG